MNFLLAMLSWLVMGAVLGLGLFLFVAKGTAWLLALSLGLFILIVGRICATSH